MQERGLVKGRSMGNPRGFWPRVQRVGVQIHFSLPIKNPYPWGLPVGFCHIRKFYKSGIKTTSKAPIPCTGATIDHNNRCQVRLKAVRKVQKYI